MSSISDYGTAFPNSSKVYLEGPNDMRVPMREIKLSGGEPPLRVYDPSGPQNLDVNQGLPKLRRDWVLARADVAETPPPHAHAHAHPEARPAAVPPALQNTPLRALPGARPTQL